jgi:hypothetical protein
MKWFWDKVNDRVKAQQDFKETIIWFLFNTLLSLGFAYWSMFDSRFVAWTVIFCTLSVLFYVAASTKKTNYFINFGRK